MPVNQAEKTKHLNLIQEKPQYSRLEDNSKLGYEKRNYINLILEKPHYSGLEDNSLNYRMGEEKSSKPNPGETSILRT